MHRIHRLLALAVILSSTGFRPADAAPAGKRSTQEDQGSFTTPKRLQRGEAAAEAAVKNAPSATGPVGLPSAPAKSEPAKTPGEPGTRVVTLSDGTVATVQNGQWVRLKAKDGTTLELNAQQQSVSGKLPGGQEVSFDSSGKPMLRLPKGGAVLSELNGISTWESASVVMTKEPDGSGSYRSKADGTTARLKDGRVVSLSHHGAHMTSFAADGTPREIKTGKISGGAHSHTYKVDGDGNVQSLGIHKGPTFHYADGRMTSITSSDGVSGSVDATGQITWAYGKARGREESFAGRYTKVAAMNVSAVPAMKKAIESMSAEFVFPKGWDTLMKLADPAGRR